MVIGVDVRIDPDTVFKQNTRIGTRIGNHVAIDKGFYCTTKLFIGDYVHISPYVTIIGGKDGFCRIENFVTVSTGVRIICIGDTFDGTGLVGPLIPNEFRNTLVGTSVSIRNFANVCTNAVLSPGVSIEEGAVVGANSYVSHSIPAWEVWAGSPARFIKKRNRNKMIEYAKQLGYDYE